MCAVTKGVSFSSWSFTCATNWHRHLHKTTSNVLVGYLKGTLCIAYRSHYKGVFQFRGNVFWIRRAEKNVWENGPLIYLRVWTTGPLLLISGSGSGTANPLFKTVTGCCKKMVV